MNAGALRSPFLGDLVFALFGLALTAGWLQLLPPEGAGSMVAVLLFALWVGEHFAFAKCMRASLLRLHSSMPDATDEQFGSALPAGYSIFVGSIVRSALRLMPLGGAMMALGIFAPSRKDEIPIFVSLPLMLGELAYAAYWLFGPMATLSTKRGSSQKAARPHHAPAGSWLRRQLDRAQQTSPAENFAAELVLLVWSCLLFGFVSNAFARDMVSWSDREDPMHPVALGGFMIFATWMLALCMHIPLHLESWFDRAANARTRRGRWLLRVSAWYAMAAGLGPAWQAYWHYCWS